MSKKKKEKKGQANPFQLTEAEQIALDTLDTQKFKTIIGQYNLRAYKLADEVDELKEIVKNIDRTNLKDTRKKEKQIIKNEDEVVQVQHQIVDQQNEYGTKILRFDDEKERFFRQQMIDKAKEVADLKKKIEMSIQEKNFLLAFPQREKEYQETIVQLEQSAVEAKKTHAEEIQKYERNFQKQRKKIEEDQKEAIEKIRQAASIVAQKKIRDAEQTTKENIKLNQDLELHKNELQQLQIEREQITHQNNQYKRSLAQNHEGLTEYQTVNHKQSVKIKKLKEKVEYLKDFLEKENKKFQEEVESLQKIHQKTIAEQEYEFKCLNEQLKKRSKEIRDIKGVCQMILDQRSDIEQFFLEALDQVKEEQHSKFLIGQKSLQNDSQQSYSSSKIKLPSLNSRSYKHSLVYKNKIDVNQLEEEDKDRILRIVFQKMNSGIPPKPWRQYYDYNTINDGNMQERDEENDINDSNSRVDRYRYDENQIQSQHNDSHLQEQYQQFVINNQ
ncbi:hypothetical protein ABPG72_017920 [Tetrahymena utriculariae]